VGLDKHLKPQNEGIDSTFVQEERSENYKNDKEIIPEIMAKDSTKL
jgi:hypothetical protein